MPTALPIVHEVLGSAGQPLDGVTRAFMAPRFGHDFSGVRLHTGPQAATSARAVGARAYTVGEQIVFGAGEFAPGSAAGRRLLAHELAHVVQQARGGGGSPATQEREADSAASAALAGRAVRVGGGGAGRLQRKGPDEAEHPGAMPTAQEYIDQHTNFIGDLKEAGLASDLYLLAWQSSRHYAFVLEVFDALDSSNQEEVAGYFFAQLRGDSWLEETALTQAGRDFLTTIAAFLPSSHRQRRRVTKIVLAGPQRAVEQERTAALAALKKKGKTIDVTFYTEYVGMDTAEALLGTIARHREKTKKTDAAFPMEEFDDIGAYLGAITAQTGATDFVRELHLMGHGTEDNFGFGRHFYSSDYLRKSYDTGANAPFMADGATIYMEGCAVAKGEAGRLYLKEVGRIFFGETKTGFIKGNTCTIVAIGELTECDPRTLRWPADLR